MDDDFYVTGHPGFPVYLIDGPAPVLFEAGVAPLAENYIRDIEEITGGRAPAWLFLTHSHYDHVSSAGRFQEVWPDIKVVASAKTKDILSRPKALALIENLNHHAAQALADWAGTEPVSFRFKAAKVDVAAEPGQEFKISPGLTVKALATPGHTWDFLSYWIPEKGILAATEAAGCLDGPGDQVQCEFLVDYDAYISSVKTLADLEPRFLCVGHHFVITDGDVGRFFDRSLEGAAQYLDLVERVLRETGYDPELTVDRVREVEWDPRPLPKQPLEAYLLNTRARVKTILTRLQKKEGN